MYTERSHLSNLVLASGMLLSGSITGQETRYFKDERGYQLTEGRNGKYVEVTSMVNDSVRHVEFKHLKKDLLLRSSYYQGTRPVGKWEEFDEAGKVKEVRDFGVLRYGGCETTGTDTATDKSDTLQAPASFKGGMEAMYLYMAQNMRYPDEAYEAGIQGKVYIRGRVDEHGDWQTLTICKGAHPFLDYEAWRVVESFPNWVPAMKEGKAVSSYYTLPVSFKLR